MECVRVSVREEQAEGRCTEMIGRKLRSDHWQGALNQKA